MNEDNSQEGETTFTQPNISPIIVTEEYSEIHFRELLSLNLRDLIIVLNQPVTATIGWFGMQLRLNAPELMFWWIKKVIKLDDWLNKRGLESNLVKNRAILTINCLIPVFSLNRKRRGFLFSKLK